MKEFPNPIFFWNLDHNLRLARRWDDLWNVRLSSCWWFFFFSRWWPKNLVFEAKPSWESGTASSSQLFCNCCHNFLYTIVQYHELKGTHSDHWVQLPAPHSTTQKSDHITETVVQTLLELWQLSAVTTALGSLFHARSHSHVDNLFLTPSHLPWHSSVLFPGVLSLSPECRAQRCPSAPHPSAWDAAAQRGVEPDSASLTQWQCWACCIWWYGWHSWLTEHTADSDLTWLQQEPPPDPFPWGCSPVSHPLVCTYSQGCPVQVQNLALTLKSIFPLPWFSTVAYSFNCLFSRKCLAFYQPDKCIHLVLHLDK